MLPLYPWTDYFKQNKGLKWIIDKLNHLKAKDIEYDNDTSGLEAENVQDAIDELQTEIENIGPGGTPSATDVTYDNSESGLEAENVQDAIDELANGGGTYELPIATDTRLGGIKVGARLTIDPETGVLSADDQTQPAPEPNWNVRFFDNEDGSDDNDGLTNSTPKKTLLGVLGTATDYINIVVINMIGTGYPMRVLEISNDTLGTGAYTKHIKVTPLYSTYQYKLILKSITIAEDASLIVRNTPTDLSGIYNETKTLDISDVQNNGLLDIRGGKELAIATPVTNNVTIGTGQTGTTILRDMIFGTNGSWNGDGKLIQFLKCTIALTDTTSGNALLKTVFGTSNVGEGREYPPGIVFVQNTRFTNSSGYFPTGCYFAIDNILVIHQNENVATYGLPSTAFKSNFSIN